MKSYVKYSIILCSIAVVFFVVSLIILPDTVITQVGCNGSTGSTMPKLLAALLPLALTGLGSGLYIATSRSEQPQTSGKWLFVAVIGIAVYLLMWAFNFSAIIA